VSIKDKSKENKSRSATIDFSISEMKKDLEDEFDQQ
jgi:hypothetical protein